MGQAVVDQQTGNQVFFPDSQGQASTDEINTAMSDFNNGTIREYKPSFYDNIRDAIRRTTGNPNFDPAISARSFISGAVDGINPLVKAFNVFNPTDDEISLPTATPTEKEAFKNVSPTANILGGLGTQLASFIGLEAATAGVGGAISEIPMVGKALEGLKAGTEAVKTAGIVSTEGVKVASGAAKFGTTMGEYGALESASQQKDIYGDIHLDDVAKDAIKQGVIGIATGGVLSYVTKPLAELGSSEEVIKQATQRMLASGAVMGAGTAVSGGNKNDVILATALGSLLPAMHFHGELQTVREGVLQAHQDAKIAYYMAQTGADESVATRVMDEHTMNEAVNVVNEAINTVLEAKPEPKQEEPLPANKTFTDPYDPDLFNHLSQFIPPYTLVRMEGYERLSLGNSPLETLNKYAESHRELAREDAQNEEFIRTPQEDILKNEANKARSTNFTGAIGEVASSQELTSKLIDNVVKQVIGPEASAKGSGAEEAPSNVSRGNANIHPDNTVDLGSQKNLEKGSQLNEGEATTGKSEGLSTQEQAKDNLSVENVSSKESLPPETKEVKESGLSKSVGEQAISKGLIEDFGDLPSSATRNFKEVAKRANDFINKNLELAKKIAFGEAPEEGDIRAQEMFTALRAKAIAEKDIPLINELIHNEKSAAMAKELGQRVKALDSNDPTDPIRLGREIKEAWDQKNEKESNKIKKEKDDAVKTFKEEVKKSAPKFKDWNDFIDSIKC